MRVLLKGFQITKDFDRFLVADTGLYTLVCWLVHWLVTLLNSERFLHYYSCPTVRDWIAVFPALFFDSEVKLVIQKCDFFF